MNDNNLVGLTKEKATKLIHENGDHCKIWREDKKYYSAQYDWDSKRVNIEIDNGIVTKVDRG